MYNHVFKKILVGGTEEIRMKGVSNIHQGLVKLCYFIKFVYNKIIRSIVIMLFIYYCSDTVVIPENTKLQEEKSYENLEPDQTRIFLNNLPSVVEQKKDMGTFQQEYKVGSTKTCITFIQASLENLKQIQHFSFSG